jgi:hypothetical protein
MQTQIYILLVAVLFIVAILSIWVRSCRRPDQCLRGISNADRTFTEVQFYFIVDCNISASRINKLATIAQQEATRFAARLPGAEISDFGRNGIILGHPTISKYVRVPASVADLFRVKEVLESRDA